MLRCHQLCKQKKIYIYTQHSFVDCIGGKCIFCYVKYICRAPAKVNLPSPSFQFFVFTVAIVRMFQLGTSFDFIQTYMLKKKRNLVVPCGNHRSDLIEFFVEK